MRIKQKTVLSALCVLTIALAIAFLHPQPARALAAPTLLSPADGYTVPPDTPLRFSGVTPKNTTVYFIVDGKVIGGVKTKTTKKPTAGFSFTPKKTFSSGKHTVQIQAVSNTEKSGTTLPQTFRIPSTWPRRVDGILVPANQANIVPVAVMIENLSIVRPQSGLASASVVYETLAEGGIPRLLAIFARTDMKKVGPVRSSRPYFVDWASEYQGAYLHAGGSRDALNEIGKVRLRSIDALVGKTAKYFFRAGKVASTHNLFTRGTLLKQVKSAFGLAEKKASFRSWKFKNDPPLAKRPKQQKQLTIDFKSGAGYIVRYAYEQSTNSWLRFNGGKPHTDANYAKPTQIRAKNVIVQLVPKERILDKKLRILLDITGSGKGWLLQDGGLQRITWKKTSASARTLFFLQNGTEVNFNRGSTWIEVVPSNRTVVWK
ncbi:MAG: DUF3048 domain-containing protein [bacterium]